MQSLKIIVVGAGLTGLSAALTLEKLGHQVLLIESSCQIGGRVQTDLEQGFLLDRGFQVVLDSYPELSRRCKSSLGLKKFRKGACYKDVTGWKQLEPFSILKWDLDDWKGIFALGKVLLAKKPVAANKTANSFIKSIGAPPEFSDHFLKPFFKGVFLDKELQAPADRLVELLKYFALGNACLPQDGMQAIPKWFMAQLNKTTLRLNSQVVEVDSKSVVFSNGEKLHADRVLLALSRPQLAKLFPKIGKGLSCSTSCDYFAVDSHYKKPLPILYLDGREKSPINNFCCLSAVQPTYAPPGMHLFSASAIGLPFPSEENVREYLADQLNLPLHALKSIGRKIVEHALPMQEESPCLKIPIYEDCYVAGEAVDYPSINDAINSGRKTAEILHQQAGQPIY